MNFSKMSLYKAFFSKQRILVIVTFSFKKLTRAQVWVDQKFCEERRLMFRVLLSLNNW